MLMHDWNIDLEDAVLLIHPMLSSAVPTKGLITDPGSYAAEVRR